LKKYLSLHVYERNTGAVSFYRAEGFKVQQSMTEKEMQKYIEKTDQYRGDFYRYHTGHEWVDARNYDLCLNSGKLGFEKCVEEIKAYIKVRFGETL
jgi:hypothetical protein